jgi:hypothetical protein
VSSPQNPISGLSIEWFAVVDQLYYATDPIGKEIRIGGTPFRIIGVLAHKAVEDALFRPAGTELVGGFTDGETLAKECRIAPLVLHFPLENGRLIRPGHLPRSTSCSLGAAI